MTARGPIHAFYIKDSADDPAAARPWADRSRRRTLVVAAIAVLGGLAASTGLAVTMVVALLGGGAGAGGMLAATSTAALALSGAAIWIDRALFLSSRPAFAMPGEPYDERQAALVAAANQKALVLAMLSVTAVAVVGASPLGAGYAIGAGLAGFALVMSGPQLVLAWTLPASDFDFDGESDDA